MVTGGGGGMSVEGGGGGGWGVDRALPAPAGPGWVGLGAAWDGVGPDEEGPGPAAGGCCWALGASRVGGAPAAAPAAAVPAPEVGCGPAGGAPVVDAGGAERPAGCFLPPRRDFSGASSPERGDRARGP